MRRAQPTATMKISPAGVDFIKRHEGYRSKVYRDIAGNRTIGWGHMLLPNETFTEVTQPQAESLLYYDLRQAEAVVKRWVAVPLTQGLFDALVSFVFNVGPGAEGARDGFVWLKRGGHSTLLNKLNAGDFSGALAEFPRWSFAGGQSSAGLANRRAAEVALAKEGVA